MEVHHHSHHGKKKWTEYFWEFLMLFLAVLCGFLAEYQLEHLIEHQREKQFMESMVEDLEKDVALFENESKLVLTQYTSLDTLTKIIYEGKLDEVHVRKMYWLQRRYLYPLTMRLINRTELQLTNAGGMRLIRNKQVADSIINYWSKSELLYETKENINIHRSKAKDISFTIFNSNYYKETNSGISNDTFTEEPKLMTQNNAILTEFANRISHMCDLLKFNYRQLRLERQKGNAQRLTELIKSEYKLK
jgi:hypothetical protein